jgi:DNA-directed RNA polymerase specialized sigma24 family protein
MAKRKYPYEFRFDESKKPRRIYVYFNDGLSQEKEVEISEELYLELVLLNRSVRNIESSEENHKEYFDLSEEEMVERGAPTAPSAEDVAMNLMFIEDLKLAFLELPPTQARRYLLAHVAGFTYAEIALMEGCTIHAVKKSLVSAKKNLLRILLNRVPEYPSNFGKK